MQKTVIQRLKSVFDEVALIHFSINERKVVITALEKDIKQPLKFSKKLSSFHKIYVCPRCKKTRYITNNIGEYPKRCSNCGQKFDWKEFKKDEKGC